VIPTPVSPAEAPRRGLGFALALLAGPSLVLFGVGYALFGRSADTCQHQPPTNRWTSPDSLITAVAYVDECGGALGGRFTRIRLVPATGHGTFNAGLAFSGSDSIPGTPAHVAAHWVTNDTLLVLHAGLPRLTIARKVGRVRIVDGQWSAAGAARAASPPTP
jgi:hypothetical protein